LTHFPETHWQLSSWEEISRANLRPLLLSSEGIADSNSLKDRRKVVVPEVVSEVLKRTMRISATQLWSTPSTRVIRRTGFGTIRPEGAQGLPATWSPYDAVHGS